MQILLAGNVLGTNGLEYLTNHDWFANVSVTATDLSFEFNTNRLFIIEYDEIIHGKDNMKNRLSFTKFFPSSIYLQKDETYALSHNHETWIYFDIRDYVLIFKPVVFKNQHKGYRIVQWSTDYPPNRGISVVRHVVCSDIPMIMGENDEEMIMDVGQWTKADESKSLIIDKLGHSAKVISDLAEHRTQDFNTGYQRPEDRRLAEIWDVLVEHEIITPHYGPYDEIPSVEEEPNAEYYFDQGYEFVSSTSTELVIKPKHNRFKILYEDWHPYTNNVAYWPEKGEEITIRPDRITSFASGWGNGALVFCPAVYRSKSKGFRVTFGRPDGKGNIDMTDTNEVLYLVLAGGKPITMGASHMAYVWEGTWSDMGWVDLGWKQIDAHLPKSAPNKEPYPDIGLGTWPINEKITNAGLDFLRWYGDVYHTPAGFAIRLRNDGFGRFNIYYNDCNMPVDTEKLMQNNKPLFIPLDKVTRFGGGCNFPTFRPVIFKNQDKGFWYSGDATSVSCFTLYETPGDMDFDDIEMVWDNGKWVNTRDSMVFELELMGGRAKELAANSDSYIMSPEKMSQLMENPANAKLWNKLTERGFIPKNAKFFDDKTEQSENDTFVEVGEADVESPNLTKEVKILDFSEEEFDPDDPFKGIGWDW